MSPADHHAGGRERHAPADRQLAIVEVNSLANLYLESGVCPAHHRHDRCCDISAISDFLLQLTSSDDPQAFVDEWTARTADELRRYHITGKEELS